MMENNHDFTSLGEPFAKGNTADIYLIEEKIIKVFKDYLPDNEAEYEAGKQRYAHAKGLRVPRVFDVTRINGKQSIIMEYIPGKIAGGLMYNDLSKADYYLELSVDAQITIHANSAEDFECMKEKLDIKIRSAHTLDDNQKETLLGKLYAVRYESRLCHGDFHVFNLILADGGCAVIDWVDATAGDIRADVCRTYILYLQHSSDIAETYLSLYCRKSGIPKDEVLVWLPLVAGARLSENLSLENKEKLMKIVNRSI